ncbi:MAG: hypothetical protein GVY29_04100 [Spirochaetes bacterium]|nr:hypothetical protein [Spirochaetota bacterium]
MRESHRAERLFDYSMADFANDSTLAFVHEEEREQFLVSQGPAFARESSHKLERYVVPALTYTLIGHQLFRKLLPVSLRDHTFAEYTIL